MKNNNTPQNKNVFCEICKNFHSTEFIKGRTCFYNYPQLTPRKAVRDKNYGLELVYPTRKYSF